MSTVSSRMSLIVAASSLVLGACATTGGGNQAVDFATAEQRAAAERADPLTKARFWASEYQKNPEDLETAKYFANALRGIESHDRVIHVASDTLILHPADYDMIMLLGKSHLSQNNPQRAVQAFGRAIQVEPKRVDAFSSLGLAYDQAGQHAYAQRAYQKALEIEPNRTSTLANYGLSQALSGNIDAAEKALRQAVEQPDASPRVRQNLALVLGLQGKFDEMKTIDASAPEAIMEQNAELLQRMIAGQSTVTSSNTRPEPRPEPTKTVRTAPAPRPAAAPSVPVESAGLGEIQPTGLRTITPPRTVKQVLSTAPAVTGPATSTANTKTAQLPFLRGSLEE